MTRDQAQPGHGMRHPRVRPSRTWAVQHGPPRAEDAHNSDKGEDGGDPKEHRCPGRTCTLLAAQNMPKLVGNGPRPIHRQCAQQVRAEPNPRRCRLASCREDDAAAVALGSGRRSSPRLVVELWHAWGMTGHGFAELAVLAVGDGALVLGVYQWVRSRRAGSWAPLSSASIVKTAAATWAVAVGVLLLGAVGVPASWVMTSVTGFLLGGALLLVLSSGLGWRERRHEVLMALGRGEPPKPRMVHPAVVFFAAGVLGVCGMLLAISPYMNALDVLTNAAGAAAPTDLMHAQLDRLSDAVRVVYAWTAALLFSPLLLGGVAALVQWGRRARAARLYEFALASFKVRVASERAEAVDSVRGERAPHSHTSQR